MAGGTGGTTPEDQKRSCLLGLGGAGSAPEPPASTDQFHSMHFLCASRVCGHQTPRGPRKGGQRWAQESPVLTGVLGQQGVWCLGRGAEEAVKVQHSNLVGEGGRLLGSEGAEWGEQRPQVRSLMGPGMGPEGTSGPWVPWP